MAHTSTLREPLPVGKVVLQTLENKLATLSPHTVVAFHEDNGQICVHHVMARNGLNAFAAAAKGSTSPMTMVVAMPGHINEGDQLVLPGTALVESGTVLSDREVFGTPPRNFRKIHDRV